SAIPTIKLAGERKEKNESTNSLQKHTNSTTSHRAGARRRRSVDSRAGPGDACVRIYNHQPFIPWTTCRHCARRSLSGWLARLDVQRDAALRVEPQDEGEGRFGRLCCPKHVDTRGSHWLAHASWSQPGHGHRWHAYRIRGLRPRLYAQD